MFYIVSRSRCVKVEIVEVSRIALGSRFDYVQNCCQYVCTHKYDDGGGETLFSFFIIGGARPGHLSEGRKMARCNFGTSRHRPGKSGNTPGALISVELLARGRTFRRLGMMMTKLQLDH